MSLLKRIEQGQTKPGTQPENSNGDGTTRLLNVQSRRVAPPGANAQRDTYMDLKTRVQNRLLAELDPSMDISRMADVRSTIQELFEQVLGEENIVLSRPERARLYEQIAAEILGFGPLQPLLEDETITEIMVNGARNIYIERSGKLSKVPISFESEEHVMRIIDRIVAPLGRRIDESSPYVDARLPDGSRVNAVIPPISLVGPVVTIRKFFKNPISVEQLIQYGSLSPEALTFLKAAVESRLNIVISGGTGSGKTTLLNALSGFLPTLAPVAALETFRELDIQHPFLLRAVAPAELPEGTPGVTLDWVLNVIYTRMNPAAVLVGEVVGPEALQFLKATCLGRKAMTTIHGGTVEEALMRLEQLALASAPELGLPAVRSMVSMGVDVVALMGRVHRAGRVERSLQAIAVVNGLDADGEYKLDFLYRAQSEQANQILGQAYQNLAGVGA